MVPPIMIMSITNRYNLKCKGCFASTLGNSGRATYNKMTMDSADRYREIHHGRGLGIFTFLVAGGESFVNPHGSHFLEWFVSSVILSFRQ